MTKSDDPKIKMLSSTEAAIQPRHPFLPGLCPRCVNYNDVNAKHWCHRYGGLAEVEEPEKQTCSGFRVMPFRTKVTEL